MQVASLVPGRVAGVIETDPARSGPDRILLIGQDRLAAVSVPPAGLVLSEAAPFSHPMIRWLGRGIPVALIGAEQAALWGRGAAVVLDTALGELRVRGAGEEVSPWQAPPVPEPGLPVRMADGTEIGLHASVADAAGAGRALACGATGIGLVRSEYLLPEDGGRPSPAFYRRAFSDLLAAAEPLPVTVRLLDLTPDKWPAWLAGGAPDEGPRGLRGSQLHSHPSVRRAVEAELAALKDLGASGRLRAIWPSGGSLADFRLWREKAKTALPLGAMVETPMETLALDRWLEAADFVALGCNDLLQHLCGADRDDPARRDLLDPYRPELFRFLREGAARAGARLARVQLCGLLPQIDGILPVLIGLGYRNFSCEPALIPLLARCVGDRTLAGCAVPAGEVCSAKESGEVRALLGVRVDGQWGLARDTTAPCVPPGPQ